MAGIQQVAGMLGAVRTVRTVEVVAGSVVVGLEVAAVVEECTLRTPCN